MVLNCSLDLFIVHLMLTSEVLTLNHFLSTNSVRMEANHHAGKGPSLFQLVQLASHSRELINGAELKNAKNYKKNWKILF